MWSEVPLSCRCWRLFDFLVRGWDLWLLESLVAELLELLLLLLLDDGSGGDAEETDRRLPDDSVPSAESAAGL